MICNGYTGYVTSKLPYSPCHIRSCEPDPEERHLRLVECGPAHCRDEIEIVIEQIHE